MQTRLSSFSEERPQKEAFIDHPLIKRNAIEARAYQQKIARHCLEKNTAVILPTGLGKTIIAFLAIAEILPKKILFLAPTKPLVNQHYEDCQRFLTLNNDKIVMLSGSIPPKKREALFRDATLVVATPQTIKNDLEKGRFDLSGIGLVIFDEMHKAVEKYAYVGIAEKYPGLILGLTASPGARKKKIGQVFANLKIEQVESRTRDGVDVMPYIKNIDIEWIKVPMDEHLRKLQQPLNELFLEKVKKLNRLGILTYKKPQYISKKDILGVRMLIRNRFGNKPYAFACYNNQAVLLQTYHCLELIESQGTESFLKYVEKFEEKKLTRSEKMFYKDSRVQKAIRLAMAEQEISHPKLPVLKRIITGQFKKERDSLILIFTQYRNTVGAIKKTLHSIARAKVHRFVGQASIRSSRGMKQQEQKEVIDRFKKRDINVLIATSVAEEGIDVPNVNLVIFYEPVPSEIRAIQRRGRTGRSHIGKVIILMTQGTRDEAYFYTERSREKKMHRIIEKMG